MRQLSPFVWPTSIADVIVAVATLDTTDTTGVPTTTFAAFQIVSVPTVGTTSAPSRYTGQVTTLFMPASMISGPTRRAL